MQRLQRIACIASPLLLQITFGCSTDGPDCVCSREYDGQDAELGQASHTHLGSGHLLWASDPPIWRIAQLACWLNEIHMVETENELPHCLS
jgi:hypothetical protein